MSRPLVRNAGKFGKVKRGGGRHFSRDLSRLDKDGNPVGKSNNLQDDDEDEDEENSSDDEDKAAGDSDSSDGFGGKVEKTSNKNSATVPEEEDEEDEEQRDDESTQRQRPQDRDALDQVTDKLGNRLTVTSGASDRVLQARRDKKLSGGGAGMSGAPTATSGTPAGETSGNMNRSGNRSLKLGDVGAPREMSRREREEAEKKAARERYLKLHAAGKTDEAKRDLARLKEIRKQREAAAAAKKEEEEAKAAAQRAALEKSGKKIPGKR
ncbi:hypothetical protein ACM66B_006989 [Microbotryomycetes sp. NB124-2]